MAERCQTPGGERLNIYCHVPFCRSKCGYCAFYSETGAEEFMEPWLAKVRQELATLPPRVQTVYIGGGTPTLLPIPLLRGLLAALPRAEEVSMEANPETLTEEKVALLRQRVTRLSLGVQSFSPELRTRIGRCCSQGKLEQALALVRAAAFPHWNLDLIYALPGQSMAGWERELAAALETGCDHLSCYALTAEENARLGATLPMDEERAAECWVRTGQLLAAAGMPRYEISNYARPGAECRHNVSVWRGGLLRGIGPAAAGFDGTDRYVFPSSLRRWLAGEAPERDRISKEARNNEIFAVNLRTTAGWQRAWWQRDPWEKRIAMAENTAKKMPGCLEISPDGVKLTENGLLFWNSVAEELL